MFEWYLSHQAAFGEAPAGYVQFYLGGAGPHRLGHDDLPACWPRDRELTHMVRRW